STGTLPRGPSWRRRNVSPLPGTQRTSAGGRFGGGLDTSGSWRVGHTSRRADRNACLMATPEPRPCHLLTPAAGVLTRSRARPEAGGRTQEAPSAFRQLLSGLLRLAPAEKP